MKSQPQTYRSGTACNQWLSPQANELVECKNTTIRTAMLKLLRSNKKTGIKFSPGILMEYRTSTQANTGYSPCYLMHSREAKLPVHRRYDDTSMKEDVPAQVTLDEADQDDVKTHLKTINNLRDALETPYKTTSRKLKTNKRETIKSTTTRKRPSRNVQWPSCAVESAQGWVQGLQDDRPMLGPISCGFSIPQWYLQPWINQWKATTEEGQWMQPQTLCTEAEVLQPTGYFRTRHPWWNTSWSSRSTRGEPHALSDNIRDIVLHSNESKLEEVPQPTSGAAQAFYNTARQDKAALSPPTLLNSTLGMAIAYSKQLA